MAIESLWKKKSFHFNGNRFFNTSNSRTRTIVLILCLAIGTAAAGCSLSIPFVHNADSGLVPAEVYFHSPEISDAKLSPDGGYIAFLKPWQGVLNIYTMKNGKGTPVRISDASLIDIRDFIWKDRNRIVYVNDQDGTGCDRLFIADPEGLNPKALTPDENVRIRIVDRLVGVENTILIEMNKRRKGYYDAYRFDLLNEKKQFVAKALGPMTTWIADNSGSLRCAVTTGIDRSTVYYRKDESLPFTPLMSVDFKDAFKPLCFTFDNRYLYVLSDLNRDKEALFTYDPDDRRFVECLFEHPQTDVDDLLRSTKRKVPTGVTFLTDRRKYHFFDEERKRLQEAVERRVPESDAVVTDLSLDETIALVRTYDDRSRGALYLYDVDEDELKQIFDFGPQIDDKKIRPMRHFLFRARDGLAIDAYLTMPDSYAPESYEKEKPPLVVIPHAGPWARNVWGYDPEVRFLANRGLAVLQVNYRGSVGYGKSFWRAGFKEWGGKIQDDIADGVRWVIDQGLADPERIGIYGTSFGGYAALTGVTRSDGLYACAASRLGFLNLGALIASHMKTGVSDAGPLYETIGDPYRDQNMLSESSPLFLAKRITEPVLLSHYEGDPNTSTEDVNRFVDALEENNVPVRLILADDEQGISYGEAPLAFYRALETFFGEHLGSRVLNRK